MGKGWKEWVGGGVWSGGVGVWRERVVSFCWYKSLHTNLLCAFDYIQVCHGDIKAENVMVTGWNWALLTDVASFKPVYLPEDNPADFNFFFDTSRRRTCYIAPERFLDSKQTEFLLMGGLSTAATTENKSSSGPSLPDMDLARHQRGKLMPAMDIFSAGYGIAAKASHQKYCSR